MAPHRLLRAIYSVQYCTALHYTALLCNVLIHAILPYSTKNMYGTALYSSLLYRNMIYYGILHYSTKTMYCTALYCTTCARASVPRRWSPHFNFTRNRHYTMLQQREEKLGGGEGRGGVPQSRPLPKGALRIPGGGGPHLDVGSAALGSVTHLHLVLHHKVLHTHATKQESDRIKCQ